MVVATDSVLLVGHCATHDRGLTVMAGP